jgi:hypothetical protein
MPKCCGYYLNSGSLKLNLLRVWQRDLLEKPENHQRIRLVGLIERVKQKKSLKS